MEHKAKDDLMVSIVTYAKTPIAENHSITGGNQTDLLEIMDKHLFTLEFTMTGHTPVKAQSKISLAPKLRALVRGVDQNWELDLIFEEPIKEKYGLDYADISLMTAPTPPTMQSNPHPYSGIPLASLGTLQPTPEEEDLESQIPMTVNTPASSI